jgi:general stress protein YciG
MWMRHFVASATELRKRIMANIGKSNPGNLSKDREKTDAEKKGGDEAMRKNPNKAPEVSKKGGHPTPGGGRGQ